MGIRLGVVLLLGVAVLLMVLPGLSVGGYKVLTASGVSMEPVITDGDVILVDTDETSYSVGEIVTYYHWHEGDRYSVTHRIVDIRENGIITKGDSLNGRDHYVVQPGDITGRVVFVSPRLGPLITFMNTVQGYVIFIVIPAALLVFREVLILVRSLRTEE